MIKKYLENSAIYRVLSKSAGWIDSQWGKSQFARAFLTDRGGEKAAESSIFRMLWEFLRLIIVFIFEQLHLDRLFKGSILTRCFFWCCAAAALAPIIPTMAVLGITAIAYVSFAVRLGCSTDEDLLYTPVNKFVILYAFIYAFCTFTSVTVSGSLKGGALTCCFVLFSVILQSQVKTRRQLNALVLCLIGAGSAVALYGIFQYVTGKSGASAWIDQQMFSDVAIRVYSTLENPNVLSEYLLLIIPLTAAAAINAKTSRRRTAFLMAAAVMLLCMVLTFSRGGWLGLIATAALFLVLLDRRIIPIGIAAMVALLFVLPDSIISRFSSIGNLSDSSTAYRFYIWMGTLKMLKDYWFCGIGTGEAAFRSVYPAYSYNAVVAPHAHNLFLQVTVECGVCGLIILLAVMFSYFKTSSIALANVNARRNKIKAKCDSLGIPMMKTALDEDRIYLISGISGMAGFIVQSMTDYSFYNYRVMFLFWVFISLGMVFSRISEKSEANK